MTIAATITSQRYTGNGVTTQFAFPNKIFAAADLVVTLFDLLGTPYSFVNFLNGTTGLSYSVQSVDVDAGCTVVFSGAITTGWTIDIRSLIPDLQSTSIKNQGSFFPELHEEAFDRATRMIQDLLRLAYLYGIHGPDIEAVPWPALPIAALRKGMALMFDAGTGLPTLGVPNTQTITTGLLAPFLGLGVTNAEGLAGVSPASLAYPPGDLRRYASFVTGGGDVTTALQNACAQHVQPGGAPVYIPDAMGALTVTAGVPALNTPVQIYGDGFQRSQFTTANDITIFTLNFGASGSIIRDLTLTGKGAGATLPGILHTNCNQTRLVGMLVKQFGVGVRYAPGINSSYLCSIRDSQIISNQSINIDAQKATNLLSLYNVTFGGGPCATGLKFIDSTNLVIDGFDCEGVSLVGIDIDNPTFANVGSYSIKGGDFESNTASAGDIRLGAADVNPVFAVNIQDIYLSDNNADSFVNLVNCVGVKVRNVFVNAGYAGGGLTEGLYRIGAHAKQFSTENVVNVSGSLSGGLKMLAGQIIQKLVVISYSASMVIDASSGNEFEITATNNTAFAINAPTNPYDGQPITITVRNTSGGALGVATWNGVFKMGGAWTQPANGFSRSIIFVYRLATPAWVEQVRSPADVPN